MKRVFDVLISSAMLLLFFPVILVVALMVYLKMGRPILFSQLRPGLSARPFTMLKFRTMLNKTDANNKELPDELRLTRFGKFLRSTSLDELPELWNVLKGDMSLVGPRPLLMEYLTLYSTEQARRHEIKPGITGWAQVNGRNALSWEQKFALDVWYVDHWSFGLDLKILWRTLTTVIFRQGISGDNHATMPPFKGNMSARS